MTDIDRLLAAHGLTEEGYQPATMDDALYCAKTEVFVTLFKTRAGWEVYIGAPGLMERFEISSKEASR